MRQLGCQHPHYNGITVGADGGIRVGSVGALPMVGGRCCKSASADHRMTSEVAVSKDCCCTFAAPTAQSRGELCGTALQGRPQSAFYPLITLHFVSILFLEQKQNGSEMSDKAGQRSGYVGNLLAYGNERVDLCGCVAAECRGTRHRAWRRGQKSPPGGAGYDGLAIGGVRSGTSGRSRL